MSIQKVESTFLEVPGNHEPLDLAGPLVDLQELGVPHQLLDRDEPHRLDLHRHVRQHELNRLESAMGWPNCCGNTNAEMPAWRGFRSHVAKTMYHCATLPFEMRCLVPFRTNSSPTRR